MTTIETSVIDRTYDITPVEFDDQSDIVLAPVDLYRLTLYGAADGQVANERSRVLAILSEMAQGDGPPGGTSVGELFEASYTLGFGLDRQNYDGRTRAAIERLAEAVVGCNLGDRSFLSEAGRLCLSEEVTSAVPRDQDARLVGLNTYVLGFSAGVVGRQIGRDGFNLASGEVPELRLPLERTNLLRAARDLQDSVKRQPEQLVLTLGQVISDIRSLDDLRNARTTVGQMLPRYMSERVQKVITGKKQTKTQVNGRIASFWSVEGEDPNIQLATAMIPDVELPSTLDAMERAATELALKRERYAVAGELGELRLTQELLARDIADGKLPADIRDLISIYLLTSGGDRIDRDTSQQYRELCSFMADQFTCNSRGGAIERFMSQTPYWQVSGRRQVITPDTYKLTAEQSTQIAEINGAYIRYFQALVGMYREALTRGDSSPEARLLVSKLEGGLPTELVPICRQLMTLEGSIDSLRFDLIPDEQGRFWVGEAQIISGGTPPAVLYRQAFENAAGPDGLIGQGVLQAFTEKVRCEAGDKPPLVAILYSERPYSSDISKTTSWAGNLALIEALRAEGIESRVCFAQDLVRQADGQLYFADGSYSGMPITTVYNRVDYVSGKATEALYSDAMQGVLGATAERQVSMFPSPYPILFGKGVYALIWDTDFEATLRKTIGDEALLALRSCTPPTYWVDESIARLGIDPTAWVRKGSYNHATIGLVIGPDDPASLAAAVSRDASKPYSAVIQRYVDSDRPQFRVLRKFRNAAGTNYSLWVPEAYRLRVEPTSIDGRVCEVFVTGSPDRVVHGRETSIMTVASRG